MKDYVKVIINLLISVRILISSFLAAVVIFGCSVLVFASEETQEQIPEGVLIVDQDQAALLNFSSEIKAASATDYTTTDIYNLLNSALKGSSSSSTYSLPYIANRVNTMNSKVSSIDTNIASVKTYLYDISNSLNGPSSVYNVLDALYYQTDGGNMVSASELLAYVWVHSDSIDDSLTSYLPVIQQALSSVDGHVQQVKTSVDSVKTSVDSTKTSVDSVKTSVDSTKTSVDSVKTSVDTLHSDLSTSWTKVNSFSYLGSSDSFDGTFDFLSHSSDTVYLKFHCQITSDLGVVRFTIPFSLDFPSSYYHLDFYRLVNSDCVSIPVDYYIANYSLYLYNVPNGLPVSDYIIAISSSVDTGSPVSILAAPSSSVTMHYSSTSLYAIELRNLFSTMNQEHYIKNLSDLFASPDLIEAQEASQGVIDQALDDFTGSGSGAAKISDSVAMSSVSGSVQSGLETGASVSNATSVFNLGSDFWGWFSQSNSDYINNPYPAPSYVQTRGSGDEVVDFLSSNENELRDLLGGD